MIAPNYKRLYGIAAAVLLAQAAGLWLGNLWAAWHRPLMFDDAYMFARYAANMRHGLGLSWNLDGDHTYGPTSLLWTWVVVVLSYLPMGPWKMLGLGSWVCSIGAVVAIAWAVAVNARSWAFAKTWRVLPVVALPLAVAPVFAGNAATGMETMLAMLLAAVFVGLALKWRRGEVRPEFAGVVGLLLFLARPESGIAVVMLPVLLFLLMPGGANSAAWGKAPHPLGKERPKDGPPGLLGGPAGELSILLGVFCVGVLVEVLVCRSYFGTAFPLSFYVKGRHAYEGYAEVWHPELFLLAFLSCCQIYLAAMVLLGRRRDWRLIVCCVAPALVVFAYLQTVTQIMGFNARFYAPYLAFFIVPALLVVDRWIDSDVAVEEQWLGRTMAVRSCVVGVMVLCFLALTSERVQAKVRRMERRSHVEYDPVRLDVAASAPLPVKNWDEIMTAMTDLLVVPLPRGVTVAATEVGYLGSRAGQVNVIDLAGLNDTSIALHGFDMGALMARKPDIVWMPNTNYTYQRGLMMTAPALLEQYDLYADAANYGLAVRKDSPFRAQIEMQMKVFWNAAYPGTEMADYKVRSVSWTGSKFTVTGD